MHFLQIWVREVALRSASDALRWDGPCRLEGLCRCKVVAAALLAGPAILSSARLLQCSSSGDRRPTDRLFRTRHTKSKFVPVSRCQAILSKSKWRSDHDLKHSKSGLLTSSHNRRYGDLPTAGFSQRRSPTVRGFPQPDAPLACPGYSSLRSVFFSSDPCRDGAAVRSVSFGARTTGWFDIGQLAGTSDGATGSNVSAECRGRNKPADKSRGSRGEGDGERACDQVRPTALDNAGLEERAMLSSRTRQIGGESPAR